MKTFYFTLASLLLLGISTETSFAQKREKKENKFDNYTNQTKVIVIGDLSEDQIANVKDRANLIFVKTYTKGFGEAQMPQFLITDKKNRAVFAVGGFAAFRGGYDFNNSVDNTDFVTYNIPMTSTLANQQRLLMDASTSRLFFKTVISTNNLGPIEAYISTDFRGPSKTFRLREAYVKFYGFTLGQTTSLMTDLNSSFNTIDFEGPNSYTYLRNLGIHYNLNMGKGWSMAVGLEYPMFGATTGNYASVLPQRVPDIPLYFQYSWDKSGSHVRATGILRNFNYADNIRNSVEHQVGYGVQLSTSVNFGKVATFYGNAVYGSGIASYVNDLEGNNLDMVASPMNYGKMDLTQTFGWLAGMQFNITKKIPMSFGYSQVRQYYPENYSSPNGYKFSQYIVGNIFYNFNRALSIGAEYSYGTRHNLDGSFGKANRAQMMVRINF